MCRVYGGKKTPAYVRLCYRFGHRRGEKIYFDGEPPIGSNGHYNSGLTGQRESRRTGYLLIFAVPAWTTQAVVNDMARYAHASATQSHGTVTLRPLKSWRNTEPIVERAQTFGWVLLT